MQVFLRVLGGINHWSDLVRLLQDKGERQWDIYGVLWQQKDL